MVAVVILLGTFFEVLDVDVAHLAGRRWRIVFAVEDVLTAAGGYTWCFVDCWDGEKQCE